MPPAGGTRTAITYGYGGLGAALSGKQADLSQFANVFGPGDIFSPGTPVLPADVRDLRLWDYPGGYNLPYKPRSYEPISFEELRGLAENHDLTRMAIETRKDQIEKLDWEIKPRDEDKEAADALPRAKKLMAMWAHPDGERPFGTWLREVLEDLLVLDAPALEILRNRDGTIRGLDVVDGATIKLLIDYTGRRPKPPAPAYVQIIHGLPWRALSTEELIYWPRNVRPHKIYGFSPVQQILKMINIGMNRETMQLNWFTEGNIPKGLINAPDGWPAKQIQEVQGWFDSTLEGNLAERSKAIWAPYGSKYQPIKDPPLKDEFDEWVARVVMFCFSLPPDAFIRQRNRATAQTARQTALEEGLAPLMGWVKRLFDHVIQIRMGNADLEFAWQEVQETDPKLQAEVATVLVRGGLKTPNEARDDLGLEPVEGGDDAMIIQPSGAILLKDIATISELQANPPAPPPVVAAVANGSGAKPPSEVGKSAGAPFRAAGEVAGSPRAKRPSDARRRAAAEAEARAILLRAGEGRGAASRETRGA